MAQRRSPVHWYVDLRSGEAIPYVVQAGQRVWVTHAKLVDPASVPAGQTAVRVALRTRTGDSESLVLSAERPSARVRSTEVLEDNFWLERDEDGYDNAVVVRFRGRCINLLAPETVEGVDGEEESDVEDDDDDGAVLGIEDGEDMVDGDGISDDDDWEEENHDWEEGHDVVDQQEEENYDADAAGLEDYVEMVEDHDVTDPEESDDDDDRIVDHDWEEEESDGEFEVRGEDELDVSVADQVYPRLLGGSAWRFAATGSTAGYMQMQVVTAAEVESQGNDDRQILVHYRYTRFSAACRFDGGVEACGSTMEHQLRFIADGSHGARSLAWAGASLVPLIYPAHYSSNRLGKLWSRLIAGVGIPPHATRVEVFVEVGILRPEDRTPARITHMRDILKDMMAEPWPEGFTGMELHLPEPVRCGHDDEDDDGDTKGEEQPGKRRRAVAAGEPDDDNDTDGEERPGKRRRVVSGGETCTVCLELLEGDDLAAWPGCGKPHVFHGRCLELVLEKSDRCPICRRRL